MYKKVMSVRGEISEEQLGLILPHEHFLFDVRNWMHPLPEDPMLREAVKKSISLENRGEVVYKNFYFEDNLIQGDIEIAIDEARKFKVSGGETIVDLTTKQVGKNPKDLLKISDSTGLNIIMGSGNYVESSLNKDDKKKSERQIAKEVIKEFEDGIDNTGIKPGVIGEIGISNIKNSFEIKNLKASAFAQKKIGCGLIIHPPIWEKNGKYILDILEEAKVDINKVVLCHCDPTLDDADYHDFIAKKGAYIEYDQFGMEVMTYEGKFLPSDGERIEAVLEQIKRGNINKILISHDICFKTLLTKWGGWGYSHIINHIIPRFKQRGLTQDVIDIITKENPKNLLCW